MMKVCKVCNVEKDCESFTSGKAVCKVCRSAAQAQKSKKTREQNRIDRYAAEREKFMNTVVASKRQLFLTPEEFMRLSESRKCEFIHLKDFPSPLREWYRRDYAEDLKKGFIKDIVEMNLMCEHQPGCKSYIRYLI
jgi:hypothetical protein